MYTHYQYIQININLFFNKDLFKKMFIIKWHPINPAYFVKCNENCLKKIQIVF